jgi:hypothetical protein
MGWKFKDGIWSTSNRDYRASRKKGIKCPHCGGQVPANTSWNMHPSDYNNIREGIHSCGRPIRLTRT